MSVNSPRRLVRLIDPHGRDAQLIEADAAHQYGGRTHRAFSVVLHDGAGKVLLQRRASCKERWPGYVANTCCGHPAGLRSVEADAQTRIAEELGITGVELTQVGVFSYQAVMADSVWAENEVDHVFVGRFHGEVDANPDEVSESIWVPMSEWRTHAPVVPWLEGVMDLALPHIEQAHKGNLT